jgi:predicted nucleic acid-binding protein
VVDASVALAWCFADEQEPYAVAVLRLLESRAAIVPSVWPLEVANALVIAERRGRLQPARTAELIAEIAKLGIEVDSPTSSQVWKETLTLARRYRLSVYDAAYLELAIRESLPLATLDQALAKVARRVKLPDLAV